MSLGNLDNHFIAKRKPSKKVIIITAVAAVVLVATIIVTLILCFGKETENDKDLQQTYNLELTGDATVDPQNAELNEEEGATVEAQELVPMEGRSNGIDVSKWQGKIDWKAVKNSGIEFAFIRIGYRGENGTIYKDDNADYNIQQAQEAGVLVGVYFFSTAVNEVEAKEEAHWTLKAIEGYSISYPVVYDCEGYKSADSRMYDLNAETRTNNAITFLKTVSDAGYDAMFYGARNDLRSKFYWDVSQIEDQYKVWVAYYPAETYPQAEAPEYHNKFHAWQYTNKGSVSGITGNVDMVVCYFKKELASPKNPSAVPNDAKTPLTNAEKIYTSVNEKVTAKEKTNLRTAPNTNSDIVATLKNGETATRIGVGTNGWSKLEYNGKTVYAITSYLTTDLTVKESTSSSTTMPSEDIVAGNTFTAKSDKVTAKEFVNLRALPTTDSEIVGTLTSGDFLERTAVSNKGWSRLMYNGQAVYAVTSYLSNEIVTPTVPSTPEPEAESDGFTAVDEMVTAKEETNLRTGPSTDGTEVVHKLLKGEYVRRIGVHTNGWSKLEYNGQIVYAITSYLTTESDVAETTESDVQND